MSALRGTGVAPVSNLDSWDQRQARRLSHELGAISDFGLRASEFFRISDFGLRIFASPPVFISKQTDYALRALFTLVEFHGRGPIPIRELARRNEVPKRFLEQIMLKLKRGGWVESLAGVRGGYLLAKAPGKITLGEVVRAFDSILAPIECVSVAGYKRCSQEPVCRFRRVFLDARNYVTELMDGATLEAVARGTPVSRREVFGPSFDDGAGI